MGMRIVRACEMGLGLSADVKSTGTWRRRLVRGSNAKRRCYDSQRLKNSGQVLLVSAFIWLKAS